jgi:hypothetical protein
MQTSKHAVTPIKQKDAQTNKQTNKQTHKHASKQTDTQTIETSTETIFKLSPNRQTRTLYGTQTKTKRNTQTI